MALIFDEQSMMDSNVFKYEKRLASATRFLTSAGAVLVRYFNLAENRTTTDRGLKDIDQLFGKRSPLRFNDIKNFPLYEFGQTNPNNTDEQQLEDITAEGECTIQPSTIVPHQYDMFILNHIRMFAIFQVVDVQYDSMKQNGLYKIKYRLLSTSEETLHQLENQVVGKYDMDLSSMGTGVNPIIQQDDYILMRQLRKVVSEMIRSYKAMFYDARHNCFLYYNPQTGRRLFDVCGNEFMATHGIMNDDNSNSVVMLHGKVREPQFPALYNYSIYKWLELDAPKNMIQQFHYILADTMKYPTSSFGRWNEMDIDMIWPVSMQQAQCNHQEHCFFDTDFVDCVINNITPADLYRKFIFDYINNPHGISIKDVSLNIGDGLFQSNRTIDAFLYTPIVIYIIRKILRMR